MITLHEELFGRRRRKAAAGRRFIESQLRRLALLESSLYGRKRGRGRAAHVQYGNEAGLLCTSDCQNASMISVFTKNTVGS